MKLKNFFYLLIIFDIIIILFLGIFFNLANKEPVTYSCDIETMINCLSSQTSSNNTLCIHYDCYNACLMSGTKVCIDPYIDHTQAYFIYIAFGILFILFALMGVIGTTHIGQKVYCKPPLEIETQSLLNSQTESET